MYCNTIMGAKEDVEQGREIPIAKLTEYRLPLRKADAITSGVCDSCLAGNVMANWKGPDGE